MAEAIATARPRNRDLPCLAACATGNTGNGGVDESLVLKKAQMLPGPGPRVMDRLIGCATGRAGKPRAGLEADLEVDLLCLGIEAHVGNALGRLQAKRHREQARLGPMVPLHLLICGNDILPWDIADANRSGASGAAICAVFAPDAPHVATTTSRGTPNSTPDVNPHKSRRDQIF